MGEPTQGSGPNTPVPSSGTGANSADTTLGGSGNDTLTGGDAKISPAPANSTAPTVITQQTATTVTGDQGGIDSLPTLAGGGAEAATAVHAADAGSGSHTEGETASDDMRASIDAQAAADARAEEEREKQQAALKEKSDKLEEQNRNLREQLAKSEQAAKAAGNGGSQTPPTPKPAAPAAPKIVQAVAAADEEAHAAAVNALHDVDDNNAPPVTPTPSWLRRKWQGLKQWLSRGNPPVDPTAKQNNLPRNVAIAIIVLILIGIGYTIYERHQRNSQTLAENQGTPNVSIPEPSYDEVRKIEAEENAKRNGKLTPSEADKAEKEKNQLYAATQEAQQKADKSEQEKKEALAAKKAVEDKLALVLSSLSKQQASPQAAPPAQTPQQLASVGPTKTDAPPVVENSMPAPAAQAPAQVAAELPSNQAPDFETEMYPITNGDTLYTIQLGTSQSNPLSIQTTGEIRALLIDSSEVSTPADVRVTGAGNKTIAAFYVRNDNGITEGDVSAATGYGNSSFKFKANGPKPPRFWESAQCGWIAWRNPKTGFISKPYKGYFRVIEGKPSNPEVKPSAAPVPPPAPKAEKVSQAPVPMTDNPLMTEKVTTPEKSVLYIYNFEQAENSKTLDGRLPTRWFAVKPGTSVRHRIRTVSAFPRNLDERECVSFMDIYGNNQVIHGDKFILVLDNPSVIYPQFGLITPSNWRRDLTIAPMKPLSNGSTASDYKGWTVKDTQY